MKSIAITNGLSVWNHKLNLFHTDKMGCSTPVYRNNLKEILKEASLHTKRKVFFFYPSIQTKTELQ